MFPRLSASDSIHSPGEALRTGHGSCLALTLITLLLRERNHCGPTEVFVLPGHVAPGWNGIYFETLRQGTLRDSLFYSRHFSLDRRPWYRQPHSGMESASIGLLWHDLGVAQAERGDCDGSMRSLAHALSLLPGHPPSLLAASRCTETAATRLRLEASALIADPLDPFTRNRTTIAQLQIKTIILGSSNSTPSIEYR